ncbi:MAG: AraC family transcriptional regulator [Ruminococcus sp.]|jgi:AraC family L-rhamnose operon regulatory protein RhaS
MLPDLLEKLKKLRPQEEAILDSPLPVLYHYTKKGQPDVVDKEIVIGPNRFISLLLQPRFVDLPEHAHNFLDIIYMYSGSTCHTLNDQTKLTLQTDDILLLKPGVRHSIKATGYDDIAVHFQILPEFLQYPIDMLTDDTILKRYLSGAMNGSETPVEYLHYHLQGHPEAKNLLENMILTLDKQRPNTQLILQATIGTLFLELTNLTYKVTVGAPSSYEQEIVMNAMAYMDLHYDTASLEEYAQISGQPAYYISRLMKKYSPYTFTAYLQRRRLIHAVHLLTTTSIPIEEIISRVGYDNSSYFHRLFKKEYGTTPRQYRISHSK